MGFKYGASRLFIKRSVLKEKCEAQLVGPNTESNLVKILFLTKILKDWCWDVLRVNVSNLDSTICLLFSL